MKRGNESQMHIDMKTQVRDCLVFNGFVVKAEEQNADLVAYHPSLSGICALECERSPRNALTNIRRDLKNGAAHVIVIANSLTVKAQIICKIRNKLNLQKRVRVSVFWTGDLQTRNIAQLTTRALSNTKSKDAAQ